MFRRFETRTRLHRLVMLAVAPVLLTAAAAPMLGAGPEDDKRRRNEPNIGIHIGIGDGRFEIGRPWRRQHREVMPSNLRLAAYQAGDTIIVVAHGENRDGGYATSLEACDTRDSTPVIELHNRGVSPDFVPGNQCTPFAVTGAMETRYRVRCITVRVAGQSIEVPVEQARRM